MLETHEPQHVPAYVPLTPHLSTTTPLTAPQKTDWAALSSDQAYHIRQRILTIAEEFSITRGENDVLAYATRSRHYLRKIAIALIFGLLFPIACIAILFRAEPGSGGAWLAVQCGLVFIAALVASAYLYPKRHIHFFSDESKTHPLLSAEQESKIQILYARYAVKSPDGTPLGRISKNHLTDFLRKKWTCTDAQGTPIFVAYEDSIILSLLRRVLGNLYGLLRTHFIYTTPDGQSILADFTRDFTLRDRYTLKFDPAVKDLPDGRLLLAMGVILDTGERR